MGIFKHITTTSTTTTTATTTTSTPANVTCRGRKRKSPAQLGTQDPTQSLRSSHARCNPKGSVCTHSPSGQLPSHSPKVTTIAVVPGEPPGLRPGRPPDPIVVVTVGAEGWSTQPPQATIPVRTCQRLLHSMTRVTRNVSPEEDKGREGRGK